MEEKKTLLSYTLILHQIRKKLKLTLMEYCVADCIYHLSNNPQSKVAGWCYASKKAIAEILGSTSKTIFEIINKDIKKGFIEKDNDTKHLRTTEKWYNEVVLIKAKREYQETLHTITKGNTLSRKVIGGITKGDRGITKGDTIKIIDNNKDKDRRREVGEKSPTPRKVPNPLITKFLSYLKEKAGIIDTPVKWQRRDTWTLIRKMSALCRQKKGAPPTNEQIWNGLKFLVDTACQDKFHFKNVGRISYLYNNIGSITKSKTTNQRRIIIATPK